jgi:hypothetical protein
MFCEHHHETTWAASREDVDELERPTHYYMKSIVTALFNGTEEYFLNISPRHWAMDAKCFAEKIVVGDWKMSVRSKGEIYGKGKLFFILTMRSYTAQERS